MSSSRTWPITSTREITKVLGTSSLSQSRAWGVNVGQWCVESVSVGY